MKWCRTSGSNLAILTSYGHFCSFNEEETATSSSHFFIWYFHRQLKNFYSFLLSQLFPLTSSPEVSFPYILFLWLQHFRVKHFKSPAENTRRANPGSLRTALEPRLNSQFLLVYRDADLLWHNCCQGTSLQEHFTLEDLHNLPAESLSTVPSPCGEGVVLNDSPSSPAKGCPSSLSSIEARYTWISQIVLVDVPYCAVPPQCSAA